MMTEENGNPMTPPRDPPLQAPPPVDEDEDLNGCGLMIATWGLLVLASAVSATVTSLAWSEAAQSAYAASLHEGLMIGSVTFPFLLSGLLIGLFSIFKRFRNSKTRYRIGLTVGALCLVSACLRAVSTLT